MLLPVKYLSVNIISSSSMKATNGHPGSDPSDNFMYIYYG